MGSQPDINEMRHIAKLKGGKCQSKEYVDRHTPLKWMCKKGHTWDSTFLIIQKGGWCAQCVRDEVKEEYLKEVREIAKSKGGKCLSDKYENNHTHLEFRCANGHIWLAKSNNIKTGWWCAQCSGNAKLSLDIFQRLAKSKGGKCLSVTYKDVDEKLKWQCDKGHQWEASGYSVKNRHTWCPVCAHRIKLTIEDMKKLAASNGGKCLSTKYSFSEKLKWECAKGHQWFALSGKISSGQWCRVCRNQDAGKKSRVNFKVYQQLAKKHKGKLLSEEKDYVNGITPMKWQCEFGHIFSTKPAYIKNSGSWCPVCANKNKYSIDSMHKLAKLKGGKCLSSEYKSTLFKLEWQCKKGHTWIATPASLIAGAWCRQCKYPTKN